MIFKHSSIWFTAVILLCITAACTQDTPEGSLLDAGDSMPQIEQLMDPETGAIGKVAVIYLFSTHCTHCSAVSPRMQTIWEQFKDHEDFFQIGFGFDLSGYNSRNEVPYDQEYGLTFPLVEDEPVGEVQNPIFQTFATGAYPRVYLFDKNGYLDYQTPNYTGAAAFRTALQQDLTHRINILLAQ